METWEIESKKGPQGAVDMQKAGTYRVDVPQASGDEFGAALLAFLKGWGTVTFTDPNASD